MYKRIAAILIGCAMISTVAMTGCEIIVEENTNIATEEQTAEVTEDTEATVTTDDTTAPATELVTDVVADEEGTFAYVDETVTNPTVAPIEVPEESTEDDVMPLADITPDMLAGSWKPLIALNVADSTEVPFSQAFGSAYSQYGGSLVIADDASFTISMGASIIEAKSSGTFTMSQNNLLVTYTDGSVDTFLYIPQYRNQEVIKTQVGSTYVYFYKEA